MAEGATRGPDLDRDLRRHHRDCDLLAVMAAPAVRRPAFGLWRMALQLLRPDPTRRLAGEHAGSSPERAHGADEPGLPVPLLEHELSRRASHVPHGALSRP